jgi:hypothetical protein
MDGLTLGSINLLVLPLLGGYWFLYKFVGTHYRAERLSPQRLIFHAGLCALVLLTAARLLVYAAESGWQPHDLLVELLMFSLIPAFIALVLLSLVVTGLAKYRSIPASGGTSNEPSAKVPATPTQGLPTPVFELSRTAVGVVIGAILVLTSVSIGSAMRIAAPAVTQVSGVGFFVLLLVITACYHKMITRYMEFPFFSLALRIGLFGIIASITFAAFLFDYSTIHGLWDKLVHVPGSGISMVACLLGLVLWWPLNLLYPYQAANMRLHEKHGTTALDRLLYRASLVQHLLSISMKDGKVYIGYIQELPPNPEERNSYFEILPVASGYRDGDTHEMKLTTFYESAYEELTESDADPADWLVFLKVLKIDDILSAGRFDPDVYIKFQNTTAVSAGGDAADDASG